MSFKVFAKGKIKLTSKVRKTKSVSPAEAVRRMKRIVR